MFVFAKRLAALMAVLISVSCALMPLRAEFEAHLAWREPAFAFTMRTLGPLLPLHPKQSLVYVGLDKAWLQPGTAGAPPYTEHLDALKASLNSAGAKSVRVIEGDANNYLQSAPPKSGTASALFRDSFALAGGKSLAIEFPPELFTRLTTRSAPEGMHIEPGDRHWAALPAGGLRLLPESAPTGLQIFAASLIEQRGAQSISSLRGAIVVIGRAQEPGIGARGYAQAQAQLLNGITPARPYWLLLAEAGFAALCAALISGLMIARRGPSAVGVALTAACLAIGGSAVLFVFALDLADPLTILISLLPAFAFGAAAAQLFNRTHVSEADIPAPAEALAPALSNSSAMQASAAEIAPQTPDMTAHSAEPESIAETSQEFEAKLEVPAKPAKIETPAKPLEKPAPSKRAKPRKKREHEARETTALICEIRNFDRLVAQCGDDIELLREALANFHDVAAEEVFERGGAIVHQEPNSFTALFNFRSEVDQHAERAAECALSLLARLETLNSEIEKARQVSGAHMLEVSIGIECGPVYALKLHPKARGEEAPLGLALTHAQELAARAANYGPAILVGPTAYEAIFRKFALLELDVWHIGGSARAIYSLNGNPVQRANPRFKALQEAFSAFHGLYRKAHWDAAEALLDQCARLPGVNDDVVALYTKRLAALRGLEVPKDWDGVFPHATI